MYIVDFTDEELSAFYGCRDCGSPGLSYITDMNDNVLAFSLQNDCPGLYELSDADYFAQYVKYIRLVYGAAYAKEFLALRRKRD